MNEKKPDFWTSLRKALRSFIEPWTGSSYPMELRRAVLDEVARDVVAVREGQRIYPYTHVDIRLLAPTPRERANLEASLVESDRLAEDVRQHLTAMGCSVSDLTVDVAVTNQWNKSFGDRRFAIRRRRRPPGADAAKNDPPPGLPACRLTVIRGKAERRTYTFDQDRISIGRLREVTDEHGRLRRRNDVVFRDDQDESGSVSREHARIARRAGDYRVIDERSEAGTQIFRDGRTIPVPSRDRRGVRLRSDDVVYFGRAGLRFELLEPPTTERPPADTPPSS